jgi:hypothetical protein
VTQRPIAGLPSDVALPLGALCLAALILYPLLWPHAPVHTGDSPQYLEVARDLADGRLDALHDRTPGYPLLLVLTGLTGSAASPGRALVVAGLALHVLSVWLLAVLLHRAGGRRSVLALGVILLLPPFVEPAGIVMTENLAQFLLVVGLASFTAWLRKPGAWLLTVASLAFACATLTRPTYQALAPVLALGLAGVAFTVRGRALPVRRAVGGAVLLAAGTAIAVLGLSWYNHRHFDYFGLAPMTGFHLSTKTVHLWERIPDEHAWLREQLLEARNRELTRRGGTRAGTHTQTIWNAREDLLAATGMSREQLSQLLVRVNLDLIRRAPIEYLEEVARSMAVYWFPAFGDLATFRLSPLRWTWALLHGAIVGVFFVQLWAALGLAVVRWSGFNRVSRDFAATYLIAAGIIAYTLLVSCFADIGEPRQRRSTDVLVVLVAALGVMQLRTQTALPREL